MRSGLSLVEVLLCLALVSMVALPLWMMVVRSRQTAVRSHLALLAVQVAREEIEDSRVLAHTTSPDPRALAHPLSPVAGGVFARLKPVLPVSGDVPPELATYPPGYGRIFTRLAVEASTDARIFPAMLEVGWQEAGQTTEQMREGRAFLRFPFLLVRSKGGS